MSRDDERKGKRKKGLQNFKKKQIKIMRKVDELLK